MAIELTLGNPTRTRVLRLSVEERRADGWTLVDARLLAPGEEHGVKLTRDRRASLEEVSRCAQTLIESMPRD